MYRLILPTHAQIQIWQLWLNLKNWDEFGNNSNDSLLCIDEQDFVYTLMAWLYWMRTKLDRGNSNARRKPLKC